MPTRDDPQTSDRRWFLAIAVAFVISVALLLAAHAVYRATGPHPEVTLMLRRFKHALTHAPDRR